MNSKTDVSNTIIYLIGFPGVGKYTVAKQLNDISNIRLVDNHLVNNVVFSLIRRTDEKLPRAVWDNIGKIWDIVANTVSTISHINDSFVFTNVLFEEDEDRAWYERVKAVAQARGAAFVPVVLHCSREEILSRVVATSRAERMKLVNSEKLSKSLDEKAILSFDHPNKLILDNTHLSAEETARLIVKHCEKAHRL
jgi:hypothetical protein